jgi:hypothetical protein
MYLLYWYFFEEIFIVSLVSIFIHPNVNFTNSTDNRFVMFQWVYLTCKQKFLIRIAGHFFRFFNGVSLSSLKLQVEKTDG